MTTSQCLFSKMSHCISQERTHFNLLLLLSSWLWPLPIKKERKRKKNLCSPREAKPTLQKCSGPCLSDERPRSLWNHRSPRWKDLSPTPSAKFTAPSPRGPSILQRVALMLGLPTLLHVDFTNEIIVAGPWWGPRWAEVPSIHSSLLGTARYLIKAKNG